jgi:enolase
MPPLGDYLLGISPAAARATTNKTTMEKYSHIAGNFYGHRDAAVYDTARIAR